MPYCCETVLIPHLFSNSDPKVNCFCSTRTSRPRSCVPPFSNQSRQRCSTVCPPVFHQLIQQRQYPSKIFRFFYERGDLPCTIQHTTKGQILKWFIEDLETLNIDYYLPIFVDGLCETKYPYSFIAYQGKRESFLSQNDCRSLGSFQELWI